MDSDSPTFPRRRPIDPEALRDRRMLRLERGQRDLIRRMTELERRQSEDRLWHTSVDSKLAELLAMVSPAVTFLQRLGRVKTISIAIVGAVAGSIVILNGLLGVAEKLHVLS